MVNQSAVEEPRIKGTIAQLPLDTDIEKNAVFHGLCDIPMLKGIRSKFQKASKILANSLRIQSDHELTFDLLLSGSKSKSAPEVTKQCNRMGFMLNHIGNSDSHEDISISGKMESAHWQIGLTVFVKFQA
ncbi:MAG: hypothetical protein IPL46_19010 [Saprospiraceae bacterium]|nr:hypothetical protein [Saprospiraceae bacterium]